MKQDIKKSKKKKEKNEKKIKKLNSTNESQKLKLMFSAQNVQASQKINKMQDKEIKKEQKKYEKEHSLKQTKNNQEHSPKQKNNKKVFIDGNEANDDQPSEHKENQNKIETESEAKPKPTNRDKQRENLKRKKARKQAEKRTVFVGNIPVTWTKKELRKLFKGVGEIESVRMRCPPPADPKIPKKVVIIKKDFHADRKTLVGYVIFKEESTIDKALSLNGKVVDGMHIRVDKVSEGKQHDHSCSVFVGNLPFNVDEEQIRNHFADCGPISNVRVVRDNKTSVGKGFGYVLFQSKDGVSLALKLHKSEFQGRELRVFRSQPDHKSDSSSSSRDTKKGKPSKDKMGKSSASTGGSLGQKHKKERGQREKRALTEEMRQKLKRKREKNKKNFTRPKLKTRKMKKMFNS